jgi:hypothetical protein
MRFFARDLPTIDATYLLEHDLVQHFALDLLGLNKFPQPRQLMFSIDQ